MKIIHDIFGLILKFRGQLMSAEWRRDPDSGHMVHPAFTDLSGSFQAFRDFSHFLFKGRQCMVACTTPGNEPQSL